MSDVRVRVAELEALYAEVPRIECKGECAESCGPIGMTTLELRRLSSRRRFKARVSKPTDPDCGHGTAAVLMVGDPATLDCPLLRRGRCTVYDARPMICRLWGVVETMPCPWGCKPERYLTDDEGRALLRRVDALAAEASS